MTQGPVDAVAPVPDATLLGRESLVRCEQFSLSRVHARTPFAVGAAGVPRVLVCLDGAGRIEHGGASHDAGRGDVMLLPAALGACSFLPTGAVTVLEIALPDARRP